jgi:enamine deaminase RidA (YjgF/YER057c/UK114 family)
MKAARWSEQAILPRRRRKRCTMSASLSPTAGASFAEVVKITTYVVNYAPEQRDVIGKARASFFPSGKPPASTLVGVTELALPEWLIEIEAVAVVG